jgi:hypothetical protein
MLQNERSMHQPNPGVFISSSSSSSNTMSSSKTSWPELVGTQTNPGLVIINHDRPDLQIVLLQVGTTVSPPGFHAERVVVFFDEQTGLIAAVPAVG